jgi:Protein of unknown function (DUF1579)
MQISKILLAALAASMVTGSAPVRSQERPATAQTPDAASKDMPAWMQRGLPGPGQARLEALIGTFKQHKMIYGTLGRDPNAPPLISDDVKTTRQWVAGGRFIEDISEGTVQGQQYWRKGWLGYSRMDDRYEWVTIDAVNTTLMSYAGTPGTGSESPINMLGKFTDQGVAGEGTVGKEVGMRTVVNIEGPNSHSVELYFTPPDGKEILADRTVYTRLKP